MSDTVFAQATRNKIRFDSTKGQLSTEDVWSLPLNALDTLAKSINAQLRTLQEESFIGAPSLDSQLWQLKLDVVKYIIKVKLDEKAQHEAKVRRNKEVEQLEELIAEKENAALRDLPVEELRRRLQLNVQGFAVEPQRV